MADDLETQLPEGLLENVMEVDKEPVGSPTEVAEESDVELDPNNSKSSEVKEEQKVKIEKRKRERKKARDEHAPAAQTIPDSEDEDLESPSKRANGDRQTSRGGDEAPLTSSEIRSLLLGHVQEMQSAWTSFHGRLERVESEQGRIASRMDDVQSRTLVIEKDVAHQRQVAQDNATNLDNLAAEVKNMKVRLDEIGTAKVPAAVSPRPPYAEANPDPWGEFLRNRDQARHADDGKTLQQDKAPENRGDQLTEDERKTLVVGGWMQDTKRAVIEEESAFIFDNPEIKPLLDSTKLNIYGPRRSVGMLKFACREGEVEKQMKERMWGVVRAIAQMKQILPSTRAGGEDKTLWASFVKTKHARVRSSHVSMIRRVTIALAKEAHAASAGGISNGLNLQTTAYDCDWNLGTIWCGCLKLGSSTHRAPKEEEVVVMTGGWVSLSAVARTALCSTDEARRAFELEL